MSDSTRFGVSGGNLIPGLAIDTNSYRRAVHADRCRLRRMSRAKRKRVKAGRHAAFERQLANYDRARPFPRRWAVSPIVEDAADALATARKFRDA